MALKTNSVPDVIKVYLSVYILGAYPLTSYAQYWNYHLQVVLVADCLLKELESDLLFDAVVLPGGGKGAENLASSQEVGAILKRHEEQGKILAAVCAAPTAFLSHDIGKGKNITSYPAFKAWIILQLNLRVEVPIF